MGHLKCNRKNWEQLKKRLLRFDERSFDVGFFRREKYEDGLQVAEVAWMNDQGTSVVPPRPFMTIDFQDFVEATFHKKAKHLFHILLFRKNAPFLKEFQSIADYYKDSLREIIYDYPGHNSPAWIAEKGFDDPLFHTGTLVNAVETRIVRRNK